MLRLLSIPLRAPRLTIAATLAVTLAFGALAVSVRVDSAVDSLLSAGDPARLHYEQTRDIFGSEEATLIGVFLDNVFTASTLATIDSLSRKIQDLDGVREVISLTTVRGVEVSDEGLQVGTLMQDLPKTDAEAAAYRDRVLSNPLYKSMFIAPDGTAAGILVLYEPMTTGEFLARGIERRIRSLVAAELPPSDYAISGMQTLKAEGARLMEEDLAKFLPLSILFVVLVFAYDFRTVRGVALPLAASLMGLVWTAGVMGLAGKAINYGTLILPPMLVAIGIAHASYILHAYYHAYHPERSRRQTASAAVAQVGAPMAVAALTTMLGFGALTLSSIAAIRDLGAFSVFGIFAIAVLSLAFIPAALVVLPVPKRGLVHRRRESWVTSLVDRLGRLAVNRRWAVLLAAGIGSLLCAWGASRIHVATDYVSLLDARSAFRADSARIVEHLGGTQPLYVTIEGGGAGAMSRVEMLGAIRDLQAFIAEQPGVHSSLSLSDLVGVVWHALNPDAKEALPLHQGDVDQMMLFMGPEDLRPVASKDLSRANVIVRTNLSRSAEIGTFVSAVEEYARKRFPQAVTVRATGTLVLLTHSADALVHGQIAALVQVLGVVALLLSLVFLSIRTGFLALVPAVFPVAVLFGVMGWAGISLNIWTSMIAVIAIGIAVDDTIHYLTGFNAEIRRAGNQELAILRIGRVVGRPIVFTSLALMAGFLVIGLSNFRPIREFGALAGMTMLLALVAHLVLTPALVLTTTIVTLWDVLFVKLGPQPHREIPLFAGLRSFQARIVVLMARLASAVPGDYITRRGEMKAELYVLLSGRVDVRRSEGERVIRSLGRGDVIGEMGLVRARPRSADVQVSSATDYLVMDAIILRRLQRRYPRIAATVFLNLTRILSDRLENTTDQLAVAGRPRSATTREARS